MSRFNPTSKNSLLNISDFPRIIPENDDSPRIRRAINKLTKGGIIVFGIAEYIMNTTVSLIGNITLLGQGNSVFQTGTTFRYTGTGACFNFVKTGATAGVKLKNFKITAASTDTVSYKLFTGIDINRAEHLTLQDITVSNANIGIDLSGTDGYIYLAKLDNIIVSNCQNEGIYLRSTGGWKNGVHIVVGDISDNGIAIRCGVGQGNVIEGKASEVGRNRIGGILIEGGVWTIKGSLWIENNPYGVKTTGGHTIIDGDIYNIDPIVNEGGTLDVDRKQSHLGYIPPTQIKKGLAHWYSFEEGSGTNSFDRVNATKGTFTSAPLWNTNSAGYGTTMETQATNAFNLSKTLVDWSKDWTVMMLGYGDNNGLFLYCSADATNRFVLRPYPNGTQLSVNGNFAKNFATYPNGDATKKIQWHVICYDSTAKKMKAYSPTGKLMDTFDVTLVAGYSAPTSLYVGSLQVVDELIIYNRLLLDTEIRAITSMSLPPDVQAQNFNILSSPDGSRWKQTIDNSGVPTWTKI